MQLSQIHGTVVCLSYILSIYRILGMQLLLGVFAIVRSKQSNSQLLNCGPKDHVFTLFWKPFLSDRPVDIVGSPKGKMPRRENALLRVSREIATVTRVCPRTISNTHLTPARHSCSTNPWTLTTKLHNIIHRPHWTSLDFTGLLTLLAAVVVSASLTRDIHKQSADLLYDLHGHE